MEIWEDIGIARESMDVGIWLNGQTVFVAHERMLAASCQCLDQRLGPKVLV